MIGGDLQIDSSLASSHAGVASWRSKIIATLQLGVVTG